MAVAVAISLPGENSYVHAQLMLLLLAYNNHMLLAGMVVRSAQSSNACTKRLEGPGHKSSRNYAAISRVAFRRRQFRSWMEWAFSFSCSKCRLHPFWESRPDEGGGGVHFAAIGNHLFAGPVSFVLMGFGGVAISRKKCRRQSSSSLLVIT